MRGSPFTKKKDGKVRDRAGTVIDLFPGVREALLEVHKGHRFRGTKLAIASRTSHERYSIHSGNVSRSIKRSCACLFLS